MLEVLGGWPGAALLRGSGPAYAAVSGAHILGIGLLLGAALPMDLRLIGAFSRVPQSVIVPFLSRLAATGLGFAVVTGIWLFTVNPVDYAANPAMRLKAVMLAAAIAMIAVQHANPAFHAARAGAPPAVSVRLVAALSGFLWLSILASGRWIGFA